MFSFRTLSQTVKSSLRSAPALVASVLVLGVYAAAPAHAEPADELDVLRVDVPIEQHAFRNGELEISALIADNTYIDVDDFNLRAIELEAYTKRNGEVRLKVGRYVTPPVPLPGENDLGLLRIEAPHKTNKTWRLLIEDRVHISSLTAVLEPRNDNVSYYRSRYEERGYAFGNDPNFRNNWSYQSRNDNWPYSWLRSDYDYNRRAGHWLWLSDSRSRFRLNPSYGFNHRHTRNCYDRFGRHLSFGGQQRSYRYNNYNSDRYSNRYRTPRTQSRNRNGSYLHERNRQNSDRVERPRREVISTAPRRPAERSSRTNRDIPFADRERNARQKSQRRNDQQLQQRRQQARDATQRAHQQAQQRARQAKRQARTGASERGATRRETLRATRGRGIE